MKIYFVFSYTPFAKKIVPLIQIWICVGLNLLKYDYRKQNQVIVEGTI